MRNQRGVTIVEGLVALVILSVGMLGIASLYVASLKTGRTALIRTHAVNLVNDMLDSIRSNGIAGTAYRTVGRTEAPEAVPACATGACTREELAENDLANWLTAVTRDLPAGAGTVTVTPGTPVDVYTVAVSWREAGETADYDYRASIEMLPVRP
jgi:type IV pilus assembly protein PilV